MQSLAIDIIVRPFSDRDAAQVRELFITVNRLLAPPHLRLAFEAYIERALVEEIDRIPAYYGEHSGSFWVARMYVDPSARRQGVARQMLQSAEDECRRQGVSRLVLSTSEIQVAALALYKKAEYRLLREETAEVATNKTVGSGIRRYYFGKAIE